MSVRARRLLPLVPLILLSTSGVAVTAVPSSPPRTGTRPSPTLAAELDAARTAWGRLVTVAAGSALDDQETARVVDRLLATRHGRALVTELSALFASRTHASPPPMVTVVFADTLPSCGNDSSGCFEPDTPGADGYRVYVHAEHAAAARPPTELVFGEYPGNPDCDVITFYQEAASTMAETLYHELLHVWFVNAFAGQHRRWPTGHGVVARCEFEDDFLESLRAEALELAVAEGRDPRPAPRGGHPR